LFGSFDAASFISVDKPPASLWVSGLSVRFFGLSHWSVLLPQAAAGVATVAIVFASVRRWRGPVAGLVAGAALALTPVVVVMFRYNNPDALLTLLTVAAVAVTHSAIRTGSGWRLAGAGVLVGFAFLTKTTQALLVVPAIGIAYLWFAPGSWRRRLGHGFGAGLAAIASAGWWLVLAETSSAAPFFGQTTSGSFRDYVLGINGLDRLGGAGGGGNDPFGGSGGWARLFNSEVGGQVSWLIPLAVAGLLVAAVGRPQDRTDRAGWALWGGVFATHFLVLSLMSGVFHPYYTMTMAPSISVLAGVGAVAGWGAWRERTSGWWVLPTGIGATGVWAAVVLSRTPDFLPWLAPTVALGAVVASGWMVATRSDLTSVPVRTAVVAAIVLVAAAGPVSYSFASIGTDYSGGDPKAGPGEIGFPVADGPGDAAPVGAPLAAGDRPTGPPPGLGDAPGAPGRPPRDGAGPASGSGSGPEGLPGGDGSPPGSRGAIPQALAEFLVAAHDGETWLVATVGTQLAAGLILDSGVPVMALGGFSGRDPVPTADGLSQYIADGSLRFILLGGGRDASETWTTVADSACVEVDLAGLGLGDTGLTLYDCGFSV
jgi:4-amino-4-deoxy-L-arabinose transferase-like glycosyltransferase